MDQEKLAMEPRALYVQGKHSITESYRLQESLVKTKIETSKENV